MVLMQQRSSEYGTRPPGSSGAGSRLGETVPPSVPATSDGTNIPWELGAGLAPLLVVCCLYLLWSRSCWTCGGRRRSREQAAAQHRGEGLRDSQRGQVDDAKPSASSPSTRQARHTKTVTWQSPFKTRSPSERWSGRQRQMTASELHFRIAVTPPPSDMTPTEKRRALGGAVLILTPTDAIPLMQDDNDPSGKMPAPGSWDSYASASEGGGIRDERVESFASSTRGGDDNASTASITPRSLLGEFALTTSSSGELDDTLPSDDDDDRGSVAVADIDHQEYSF